MRILWDEPKRLENLRKHGFDFAILDVVFFEDATIIPAKENRLKAVGVLIEKLIVVIFFALGSEGLSVISMRPANKKERRLYEQDQIKHSPDNR
jgi:uncharacterized protein